MRWEWDWRQRWDWLGLSTRAVKQWEFTSSLSGLKPNQPQTLFVLQVVIIEGLALAGVVRGAAREHGWELPHLSSAAAAKKKN